MFQKKLCVVMAVIFCLCIAGCAANSGAVEQKTNTIQKNEGKPIRSKPMAVSAADRKKVFGLGYDDRPLEYIRNDLKDNGNGTITDRTTGLMWQESGSDGMDYEKTQTYIKELNRKKFAGYNDWRLPTIKELMSLITQNKQSNDIFISPIFDSRQWLCWSSDIYSDAYLINNAFNVDFKKGSVSGNGKSSLCYVRVVRSGQ